MATVTSGDVLFHVLLGRRVCIFLVFLSILHDRLHVHMQKAPLLLYCSRVFCRRSLSKEDAAVSLRVILFFDDHDSDVSCS